MPNQVQSSQLKFSTGSAEATTNVATVPVNMWGAYNAVQVKIAGTGAVSVTASLQVSNIGGTTDADWIEATSLSLTGTTTDTDGATLASGWQWMRVKLASITGTGATVTVYHAGYGL